MGFKIDDDQYRLTFGDGTRLNGAHIVIGGLTLGELRLMERSGGTEITPAEAEARIEKQQQIVASRLIEWDLEDRDGPLPMTVDGLNRLGLAHWAELVQAWLTALTSVPDAVGKASSDGTSPLEVSIPMETLPTSHAS